MKRRFFNLIAYCSDEFLRKTLDKKQGQIEYYAFIYHDQDRYLSDVFNDDGVLVHCLGELKEPHFHIVLMLKTWRRVNDVKKWFVMVDDNNKDTSVLFKDAKGTPYDCLLYLTHENAPDKYQYVRDRVVSFNIDWSDLDKYKVDDAPVDNTFDIVQDMLNGLRCIDLIKKYGRDFVYHYQSFNVLIEKVRQEDLKDKTKSSKDEYENQADEDFDEKNPFNL